MLRPENFAKQSHVSDSLSIFHRQSMPFQQNDPSNRDSKIVFTNNRSRNASPFGYDPSRFNESSGVNRPAPIPRIKVNGQFFDEVEERKPKRHIDIFGTINNQMESKKTNSNFFLPINTSDFQKERKFENVQSKIDQQGRGHLTIPYSKMNSNSVKAVPIREVSQRPVRNVSPKHNFSDFRSRSATSRPLELSNNDGLQQHIGLSLQHQMMENSFKTFQSIERTNNSGSGLTNPESNNDERANKIISVFSQMQSKIREITIFTCSCDFFRFDAQGNLNSLLENRSHFTVSWLSEQEAAA